MYLMNITKSVMLPIIILIQSIAYPSINTEMDKPPEHYHYTSN